MKIRSATHSGSSVLARNATILNAWFQEPSQVATVCPSSPAVTRCIADRDCIRRARTIFDLGPGTGCTTSAILKTAPPEACLLAVEITASFIKPLRTIDDSRLIVEEADAVDLEKLVQGRQLPLADVIVSGIPFSALPPGKPEAILQAIHRSLQPGGVFIAYQVRNHVARCAEHFFGEPDVETIWLNLPPLRIFTWRKSTSLSTRAGRTKRASSISAQALNG